MVGVGDERSGSKRHGGDRRQAVALELTWWGWDTSGCAWIDMVGMGDEWLGSKRCGGGRR